MEFSDLMIDLSSFSSFSCHPQDIIRSIKEKKILLQQQSELPSENDCADNSRIVRAQEIRQKDGISLSSKLGVFTVYDDRSFHFVKLFPPSCSCPLKEGCVHILSVQLSLNMPIQQSGLKNLTTVRKNARGTRKAKPGRKKPRVGDEDPPNDRELEHENPEQNAEHPVQHVEQPPVQSVQHAEHPPEHTEQKTEHAEHQPEHTERSSERAEHPEHAERMSEYQPEQEDIIELAGKDSSFARDVKYSGEVWIPADGKIIRENLNVSDRRLITDPCGCLNGTLIDAAMDIIQSQFPSLQGLQSCVLAVQCDFKRHSGPFIQIINRSPRSGGTHWLTVTNIGCDEGLNVCDSSFDDVPDLEAQALSTLVDIKGEYLLLHMLDVFPQNNSYDCGLYAIANMVSFVVFFVFTKNLWATFINFIQVLSAIEYTINVDQTLNMQIM